jgi:DNA repair protein RecO (recombination protein O)
MEDEGIIVGIKRFGEKSLILNILTSEHGLHAGIVNDANYKRNRVLYQVGNLVDAIWSARLEEHLGVYKLNLKKGYAAKFMMSNLKLSVLNSFTSLLLGLLQDREKHEELYFDLLNYFEEISVLDDPFAIVAGYVKCEVNLLSELGFALDISKCAVSGSTDDLCYISPKTGKAISKEAARGYENKLFKNNAFLMGYECEMKDVYDTLEMCGFFIKRNLLAHKNLTLPAARVRLAELIKDFHEKD